MNIATIAVLLILALLLFDAYRRSDLKRILIWTFKCRRGVRCAHPIVDSQPEAELAETDQLIVHMQWECGTCGTAYCEQTMITVNGVSPLGKERIRQ